MKEPGSFMEAHGFESVAQFRGHSLQYLTPHADWCAGRPTPARRAAGQEHLRGDWRADEVVAQSAKLSE